MSYHRVWTILTWACILGWPLVAPGQGLILGPIRPFGSEPPPETLPRVDGKWSPDVPARMASAATPDILFVFATIGADGRRASHRIVTSGVVFEGNDAAALLVPLKFEPARAGRKPVAAQVCIPFIFNPATAPLRGREATPRVLAASPVVVEGELRSRLRPAGRNAPVTWVVLNLDQAGAVEGFEFEAPSDEYLRPLIEASLAEWRFAPAREKGRPVPAALRLPIALTLGSPQPRTTSAKREAQKSPVSRWGTLFFSAEDPGNEDLDTPPLALECPPLPVPAAGPGTSSIARSARATLRIDATGAVTKASVDAHDPDLAKALEATLRRWRFQPPQRGGRPSRIEASFTVSFGSSFAYAPAPDGSAPHPSYQILPDYPEDFVREMKDLKQKQREAWPTATSSSATSREGTILRFDSFGRPVYDPLARTTPSAPSGERAFVRAPSTDSFSHGLFAGRATLSFCIDEDGRPTEIKVDSSSSPIFDAPAALALHSWRYQPGTGVPGKRYRASVPFGGGAHLELLEIFKPGTDADPSVPDFDIAPVIRTLAMPVYPAEALRERAEGRARARLYIDTRGKVERVELLETDRPDFGLALQAALEACEFRPALKNGQSVPSMLERTEQFSRKDPSSRAMDAETLVHNAEPERDLNPIPDKDLDRPLEAIFARQPIFPRSLTDPSIAGGEATIEYVVDASGRVCRPCIVSATDDAFGYAAVQAIAFWGFEPPMKDGRPVAALTKTTVRFSGESEGDPDARKP